MSNFGYKLSRITSYLQTGKISEREAMEQLRKIVSKELSDDDIDFLWKQYQTGQISADHTDKQVFSEVIKMSCLKQ